MSIMDQIDPPWQTVNIFVLFNAFETLCAPQCITDMSHLIMFIVNVRKSCKHIHVSVRSGRGVREQRALLRAKQTERNRIGAQ